MENKYYIPKIEEFFVGFKYESKSGNNWLKLVYEGDQVLKSYSYFDDSGCEYEAVEDDLKDSLYRVKYLDKSDIESLGFKFDGMRSKVPGNFGGTKDNLYLNYNPYNIDGYFTVNSKVRVWNNTILIFEGVIKNKSELIKLLKQLNIVDEEEKKS
jgi:hypothetical protein